jgi:ribosomal protein S6--L-glutamate ligase
MKRRAKPGEFRSNLHRGGSSIIVKPDSEEVATALKATAVMGLHVAGVDMLQSKRGPLVLEVNASPGLEGIETTTGVDIANQIIEFIEAEVAKKEKV